MHVAQFLTFQKSRAESLRSHISASLLGIMLPLGARRAYSLLKG
jgi:hypothetical protein